MSIYKEGYTEIIGVSDENYHKSMIHTITTRTFTFHNPKRPSGDWKIEKKMNILK